MYLVHGLGEYSGRWQPVAEFLSANGFTVHCVDFPGHGKTSGHAKEHVGDNEMVRKVIDLLLSFDKDSNLPKFMVPPNMC